MAKLKKDLPIFVADCETDPFLHGRVPEPFLWGVYSDSGYEQFDRTDEFMRYITDIECICYAHNGGKFDWHFITDFIEYGTDLLIINGRLSRFTVGQCQFRDSWNILPVPLGQMQKTAIDYAIFERGERDKPKNRKAIESYLYDDCRFLYQFVRAFIDRHGVQLTQASASFKTWEKMSGRKAPHDLGGDIYDKFSCYYYGGRCQAFASGIVDGDSEMVDINSAYPFAMLSPHPMSLAHVAIDYPDEYEFSGPEFLTITGPACGALPYRDTDNSLIFPDDGIVRDFHITGWEWLALGDTRGHAGYTIVRAYEFLETADFSNFILPLYQERLDAKALGDTVNDLLAKLCMNSCYGKFGSNPRNYECYKVVDPIIVEDCDTLGRDIDGRWSFAGYFGELPLVSRPLDEQAERFYNVATSASITGYVRAMLWRAICQCDGVIYCDTDSIIARSVAGLPQGDGLGAWKHEATFSGGGVGGKKLYAFELKGHKKGKDGKMVTHKTASKGAKLTADDILGVICKGGVVEYAPDAPCFSVHKAPAFVKRNIRATNKK